MAEKSSANEWEQIKKSRINVRRLFYYIVFLGGAYYLVTDRAKFASKGASRISPLQSDLLDLSRWVAAFLVVAEHQRCLMFVDYKTGEGIGALSKVFYFMTHFGHSAVMVFFVMSGFLVGGKVIDRLKQGAFSWQKYAVDRVSRLYAVYVLALLLGGALDYLGYRCLNRFGLYDRTFSDHIAVANADFHAGLSKPVFFLNLLMCQTILVPVFGSNGPLWSLANEFWYYLAGPLLFLLYFARNLGARSICVIALAGLYWFLPASILIYFLVWLLGALLYSINDRPLFPASISLFLFLGCLSAVRLEWIKSGWVGDFLIAITFAMLINSGAGKPGHMPGHVLSRRAADFSYSVYLCHFPFLACILSAIYQGTGFGLRTPRSGLSVGLSLVVLGLTYLWCYLVSLVTERQTPRIRKILYALLGREMVVSTAVVR